MQNKPNLLAPQMNLTSVITKDYENKSNWKLGENKPNSKPTCRGVVSGEAGSNPILSAIALGEGGFKRGTYAAYTDYIGAGHNSGVTVAAHSQRPFDVNMSEYTIGSVQTSPAKTFTRIVLPNLLRIKTCHFFAVQTFYNLHYSGRFAAARQTG